MAAEDIRWILEVTAPQVQKLNQTIYRQERLDSATLDRGLALIVEELEGDGIGPGRAGPSVGRPGPRWSSPPAGLHRRECRTRRCHLQWADARCSTDLCTLDERAPRSARTRRTPPSWGADSSRSRPGKRPGPGPLVLSHRQPVPGGAGGDGNSLDCVTVEGVELWFDPDAPQVVSSNALLLPLYDELTLSYPLINFPQASGHPHAPGEDLFIGSVIIAETNVGTWRRTVQGRKMIMEIALAPGVVRGHAPTGRAAAGKLATLLERTWS